MRKISIGRFTAAVLLAAGLSAGVYLAAQQKNTLPQSTKDMNASKKPDAEQLRSKLRYVPGGNAIEPVARGEVELGLRQMSEVMEAKGAHVVGYVPEPYNKWTTYTGVILTGSSFESAARDFLNYLASDEATRAYTSTGFVRP